MWAWARVVSQQLLRLIPGQVSSRQRRQAGSPQATRKEAADNCHGRRGCRPYGERHRPINNIDPALVKTRRTVTESP